MACSSTWLHPTLRFSPLLCRAVFSTCTLAHPLFHLYYVVPSLALARWHILFFQCFVPSLAQCFRTKSFPVALSRALKHFLAVLSSIRLMIALSVKLKVTVSKVFGSASFVCCTVAPLWCWALCIETGIVFLHYLYAPFCWALFLCPDSGNGTAEKNLPALLMEEYPITSANAYRKRLVVMVESVIKRMRWKAFFFLRGGGSEEQKESNEK